MYKYRSQNGAVKLNSALKDTDTDLVMGTQARLSSRAITGIEGTCWSPSIWCPKPLHPYIPQKNVMDPWPAPYQTVMITDVLLMTRNHLAATSFNTVLHQRTLQGRWTTSKSQVLLPLPNNAASFVRSRVNWSLQRCIFTPLNRE
jgi:hypothetical protein